MSLLDDPTLPWLVVAVFAAVAAFGVVELRAWRLLGLLLRRRSWRCDRSRT